MSLTALFFRFTLLYILIMAAAGIAAGLLELKSTSGLNTGVLFGVGYWCLYSYTRKNGDAIADSDKWPVLWTLLAGDAIGSALLATPLVLTTNLPLTALLIGSAVILPIHLVLLYFLLGMVNKQLRKEQASSATPEMEKGS